MSSDCITLRLAKLRALRDSLCEKEKTWEEAFAMRDWVVGQIQVLKKIACDESATIDDIKDRLDDLLCALDAGDKDE